MNASPFLGVRGAVEASGADAGVPAHYGNPLIEQRRLAGGEAITDLSNRAVLTVAGEDRLSWLNSLASQSLAALAPGASAETLFLDPNGRVEHAVGVLDDGETTWLVLEPQRAGELAQWLERMRFTLRVEVADRSGDVAVVGSFGPPAGVSPLVSHDMPLVWHDPWPAVVGGGHGYAADSGEPWNMVETIVSRDEQRRLAIAASAGSQPVAGSLALEALRIAAWRPRFATEVDATTVPHELDWLRTAVHLSKGCYRGQETVAKVHNLGHPPRRLVMLHLDGSVSSLPDPGAEVRVLGDDGGRAVGRVTSAGIHHELGPIALAVVKRRVDPGATLETDAAGEVVAAAQQLIVPPDAGAAGNVPRLPRLGAVTRPPR